VGQGDGSRFRASLTPPSSLGYLEALEAGYLVEYAVGELAFWTVVAAVVKRSELAGMLAERLAQIREVRGLTSEPVVVLRQHRRNDPVGHEATAAVLRVRRLIKDLVAFTGGVVS
jgi:hypothetical protein